MDRRPSERRWRAMMEGPRRTIRLMRDAGALLGARPGQTPFVEVYRAGGMRVRRYEPDEPTGAPGVMLVYALFNRPAILDLDPERSIVRAFLEDGRRVYVLDWGRPTRLDGSLTLEDYVGRYLDNAIRHACEDDGIDAIHLVGYSTGGTLAAIYAALRPAKVRSLSAVGAPIDFGVDGGLFDLLDGSRLPEELIDDSTLVPGELLAGGFSLVDPPEFFLGRYARLHDDALDRTSLRTRGRRINWSRSSIDVPQPILTSLLELVRTNALLGGTFRFNGTTVDLAAIEAPLATVVAEDDRFVPPASTEGLADAVGSHDTHIACPTDHLGLASDAVAFDDGWARLRVWIDQLG